MRLDIKVILVTATREVGMVVLPRPSRNKPWARRVTELAIPALGIRALGPRTPAYVRPCPSAPLFRKAWLTEETSK